MTASANALRESLCLGMKFEVAALTQVTARNAIAAQTAVDATAQPVATLVVNDGSTISHGSYLPSSNVRHRRGRGLLRGRVGHGRRQGMVCQLAGPYPLFYSSSLETAPSLHGS